MAVLTRASLRGTHDLILRGARIPVTWATVSVLTRPRDLLGWRRGRFLRRLCLAVFVTSLALLTVTSCLASFMPAADADPACAHGGVDASRLRAASGSHGEGRQHAPTEWSPSAESPSWSPAAGGAGSSRCRRTTRPSPWRYPTACAPHPGPRTVRKGRQRILRNPAASARRTIIRIGS